MMPTPVLRYFYEDAHGYYRCAHCHSELPCDGFEDAPDLCPSCGKSLIPYEERTMKCVKCGNEITDEFFEGVSGNLCKCCLKDGMVYHGLKSMGLIKQLPVTPTDRHSNKIEVHA